MKKCILLIITFIFNTFLYAQWQKLNEGLKGRPSHVQFFTDGAGWMTGDNTLLKSIDNGKNWTPQALDENWDFNRFELYNDTLFWALARSEINEGLYILKSTDSGLSWSESFSLPEQHWFEDLSVVNDSTAYIIGNMRDNGQTFGWIYRTVNGGGTWQEVHPLPQDNLFRLYHILFIDEKRGLISGRSRQDTLSILRTTDGGNSWENNDITEFSFISDLQMAPDSSIGFLSRNSLEVSYNFGVSDDMFDSWDLKISNAGNLHTFYYQDEHAVFVVMDDSLDRNIYKSTDAGETWLKGQKIWQAASICFSPQNTGIIAHNNGYYRSADQGESWQLHNLSYPFRNIFFITKELGFVSGEVSSSHGGYSDLFVTKNGGVNWQHVLGGSYGGGGWLAKQLYNFPGSDIQRFTFRDANEGYILLNDRIYKTSDQATNWFKVFESNPDSLGYSFQGKDIAYINDHVILSCGVGQLSDDSYGAVILGSSNGGQTWDVTWSLADSEISYSLKSVHVVDAVAWAVGSNGLIVKTSGLDSFNIINCNTDLPLNAVFFSDQNYGWIAGGYDYGEDRQSIMLKTKDAGMTWQQKSLSHYLIEDMFFADNLHGWAAANDTSGNGLILYTEDAADTWIIQAEIAGASIHSMHFKEGYGWVAASNGIIMRTEDGISWVEQSSKKSHPDQIILYQNYPNPFNPITNFKFQITNFGFVNLSIYNLLGQKVVTLVDKNLLPGNYTVTWDASGHSSGAYFYTLKTDAGFTATRKILLLK